MQRAKLGVLLEVVIGSSRIDTEYTLVTIHHPFTPCSHPVTVRYLSVIRRRGVKGPHSIGDGEADKRKRASEIDHASKGGKRGARGCRESWGLHSLFEAVEEGGFRADPREDIRTGTLGVEVNGQGEIAAVLVHCVH